MPGSQKLRKIAIVGSRSVGNESLARRPALALWKPRAKATKGKSSLAVQFVDGHFVESYYPTIENTFSKTIKYKGHEYATEIIDTAGQVNFCPTAFECSFDETCPNEHLSLHRTNTVF